MTPQPVKAVAPPQSKVAALVGGSYFHDCWAIKAADSSLDPLDQFLRVARLTPAWIEGLMGLRNRVVRLMGLKDLGGLSHLTADKSAAAYQPGDRVGIFTLISKSETEVLLGDSDKHLDVVVSVYKQPAQGDGAAVVTVTTVVHVHNGLGRLYMLPVRPAHRVIAKAMVRALGTAV